MDDLDTSVRLSYVTVAYALMFYGAAAILLLGLVAKIWNSLRHPTPLKASIAPAGENPIAGTIRLASEVVLFRSTFFKDRWAWIFGTCFHFGLLLVLLRHLRYVLDPSWTGSLLWQAVTIVQPFGLYGGLALIAGIVGYWARRILIKEIRQTTTIIDHLLLALLFAVPAVGYASILMHTDVVAVKDFFIGLVTGSWKQLPTDPLLLIHLWLVAVMMVVLPFGKMLHFASIFEAVHQKVRPASGALKKIKLATAVVFGLALLVPAALAVNQINTDGWTREAPNFAKLVKSHRGDDPTVMIRNHAAFLMDRQKAAVYQGVRGTDDTIERCVSCHVKKDASGQPVSAEDPKHFCSQCHAQTAVRVDCFECHTSKPAPTKQSAIDPMTKLAAIKDHLVERSSER